MIRLNSLQSSDRLQIQEHIFNTFLKMLETKEFFYIEKDKYLKYY